MSPGGMREWPNRAVSKTVVRPAYRGFESHSLRQIAIIQTQAGKNRGGTERATLLLFCLSLCDPSGNAVLPDAAVVKAAHVRS